MHCFPAAQRRWGPTMTTFNQPYIRDELTIDNNVQTYYNNCTGAGRRTVSARRPGTAHAILIGWALSRR